MLEDDCLTTQTEVCRVRPGLKTAVIEQEFSYRNCCNDNTSKYSVVVWRYLIFQTNISRNSPISGYWSTWAQNLLHQDLWIRGVLASLCVDHWEGAGGLWLLSPAQWYLGGWWNNMGGQLRHSTSDEGVLSGSDCHSSYFRWTFSFKLRTSYVLNIRVAKSTSKVSLSWSFYELI